MDCLFYIQPWIIDASSKQLTKNTWTYIAKNELPVDFSQISLKMTFFLIERPLINAHLYGLNKNNSSKLFYINRGIIEE